MVAYLSDSDLRLSVECSVPVSTYRCLLMIALANKTTNMARKHHQCGKLGARQIALLILWISRFQCFMVKLAATYEVTYGLTIYTAVVAT